MAKICCGAVTTGPRRGSANNSPGVVGSVADGSDDCHHARSLSSWGMHLSTDAEYAPWEAVATSIKPSSVTMVARPFRLASRMWGASWICDESSNHNDDANAHLSINDPCRCSDRKQEN